MIHLTWNVSPIVNDTFEYLLNSRYLIENMILFFSDESIKRFLINCKIFTVIFYMQIERTTVTSLNIFISNHSVICKKNLIQNRKNRKRNSNLSISISLQKFFIPSSNREHYRHATLNDPA